MVQFIQFSRESFVNIVRKCGITYSKTYIVLTRWNTYPVLILSRQNLLHEKYPYDGLQKSCSI